MGKTRTGRRLLGAVLVCSALLGVSACSAGDDALAGTPEWVEPGWMARARQDVEEYQAAMVACLEEHGVFAHVGVGGPVLPGVTRPREDAEATGFDIEGDAQRRCGEAIPEPSHWVEQHGPEDYERMLDVRACIVAHGHDLPEPPSMDVWLETEFPWNPWDVLTGQGGGLSPDDDVSALMRACPQSGAGVLTLITAEST
ncbi:hypothetical protein Xcel_1584 [Xylanimonas cellulosilytica DSM 15894]|uniref:Lipoprotein n=1 Tax=Xylanimonas cellulosilytica (strain DSM 15894 / JCM 12276 / CECT 5975 / KCTC 9989 / LMG 20990 / NBRC 107835 / XIL07) TaxID=446471 RepID=D1BSC0_XYLCX|nr:hypothetical protein [Xylanimonas cellulosilytica]ACZ30612.1 hypothetical protein Xcel_1584 [Xylanimonas cellulosilytica DSM 15894]